MALQEFPNKIGLPFWPDVAFPFASVIGTNLTTTMDAAGESVAYIGRMNLSTGPGTSKVISSSGGKIYFLATSVTFVNAGSTVRVGIQDVDATTGLEDGTHDVYDDLVGGTDTIGNGTITTATMSTGTKTITHGDVVAIVIEMTARGGADVIRPNRYEPSGVAGFPYCTNDIGSGPVKVTGYPMLCVEFDDGTVGTLGPGTLVSTIAATNFNSGSTPDEYALIFQVPFKCTVNRLFGVIGDIDSGDDGELILYSAPLSGSPVVEQSVTPDPDLYGSAGSVATTITMAITEEELSINTDYAVAYRPTNTNARQIYRVTIPTAAARAMLMGGTNFREGTRSDNAGAFSEGTTTLPLLGVFLNKFDDGAGGGGGTTLNLYPVE